MPLTRAYLILSQMTSFFPSFEEQQMGIPGGSVVCSWKGEPIWSGVLCANPIKTEPVASQLDSSRSEAWQLLTRLGGVTIPALKAGTVATIFWVPGREQEKIWAGIAVLANIVHTAA